MLLPELADQQGRREQVVRPNTEYKNSATSKRVLEKFELVSTHVFFSSNWGHVTMVSIL